MVFEYNFVSFSVATMDMQFPHRWSISTGVTESLPGVPPMECQLLGEFTTHECNEKVFLVFANTKTSKNPARLVKIQMLFVKLAYRALKFLVHLSSVCLAMYYKAVTNGKGNLEVHFVSFRHGFEDMFGPFAANFAVRRGFLFLYFSRLFLCIRS